ncbi:MAG: hypothetical protein WCV59_00145 [Parcubacteria group bacterium]
MPERVVAPAAIVPTPVRFPELKFQEPVRLPSVMVLVPRLTVVMLAVAMVAVVTLFIVVAESVVIDPVGAERLPPSVTCPFPVCVIVPLVENKTLPDVTVRPF